MSVVTRERVRDGIDLVTLNRPDRLNAMSRNLIDELHAVLDQVATDDTCRVMVLTGAGRAFCAGLDLTELEDLPDADTMGWPQAQLRRAERIVSLASKLRQLRVPVVAAVNGAAAGGGFALALASDVRVAATSARFNAAFVRIGLSAGDVGVSWMLPRLIGASRAFEIMLTGRFVDSTEAERIGLVSRLVADGDVVRAGLDVAEAICANSPFGVWMTKEVMWTNLEVAGIDTAVELENRTQLLGMLTDDHREAVAAFLAKRTPSFTNR
jgi:enoyl-CoA hydratase